MRLLKALLISGFLTLLIVPFLAGRLSDPVERTFEWVELKDTNFQEIQFLNAEQGLRLAGMLFLPEGEGPFPAAVIIHGSGSSHRDNGWYLTLVQHLQQNGVVVLLPDKRGSAGSEGDWRNASFEDLATDTRSAVRFLEQQDGVAISYIGIIGLSQGGHIAPLVADGTEDVAFLVNIVGGAIPLHDLLVYEETYNLRESGVPLGVAKLLAPATAWSVRQRQSEFWTAVGNFDPRPYWRTLSVPALVLYGENDTNVPSTRSAKVLRSLGNPNIEVKIYKGSGHALESPEGEGHSIFRMDALQDITNFIHLAPS